MVFCLDRGENDFVCRPGDATATPSSLAPVKSRMVYLSGAQLTQVVLEKGHYRDVVVVVFLATIEM